MVSAPSAKRSVIAPPETKPPFTSTSTAVVPLACTSISAPEIRLPRVICKICRTVSPVPRSMKSAPEVAVTLRATVMLSEPAPVLTEILRPAVIRVPKVI